MARYLVIAPFHKDLPAVPDEVAGLVSELDAKLLQGEVRARDVVEAIADGPYEGIWFATHGDAQGVQLSGEVLDAWDLAQLIAASGARWVMFNTCESAGLVDIIQNFTLADVVATRVGQGLPDRRAWLTARLLALKLRETEGDTRPAMQLAAPGGAGNWYRYWPNQRRITNNDTALMTTSRIRREDPEILLERLRTDVERLITVIDGDSDLGLAGIRSRIDEIGGSLEELGREYEGLHERIRLLYYLMGVIALLVLGTFTIQVVQLLR